MRESAAVNCSKAQSQYHRIYSSTLLFVISLPSVFYFHHPCSGLCCHDLNKRLSAHAVPVLSLSPANIHRLTSCSSSPRCFSDLIQATQETNVNVPQMADTLMERAGNASWVVVFKALITTHHLMVHGNEVRLQHTVYTHPEYMLMLVSGFNI